MRIVKIQLLFLLLLFSGYPSMAQKSAAASKPKTWYVDIFIQVYSVNGAPIDTWINEKGTARHSGAYYYAKTVKKGDDGQPVHYRFNLETVNLRETKEGSLVFKNSTSEQIGQEKKELIDNLVSQLPQTYSQKWERKMAP